MWLASSYGSAYVLWGTSSRVASGATVQEQNSVGSVRQSKGPRGRLSQGAGAGEMAVSHGDPLS